MIYAKRYIETAIKVLTGYRGDIPFHVYLKSFFAADKKYGSKDRKQIGAMCYNYFRLGNAAKDISTEEKILLGTFLCENTSSPVLQMVRPELNASIEKPLPEKLKIVNGKLSIKNIFPFAEELSDDVDLIKFNLSFLGQPDLFLRARPGNTKKVTGKLSGAGIPYKLISENCVALPNASKVDTVIELDKDAVVQDYNSQRTGEFVKTIRPGKSGRFRVWDCCAASGGKSIMAYDINPQIQLTVSDKRESILQNLYKRFALAGIKKYDAFVADLSNFQVVDSPRHGSGGQIAKSAPTGFGSPEKFDLIICDAPCSGSGTWGRTPEQLQYFKKQSIHQYAELQKRILSNVLPFLKPGGSLLYITCSVFKKENEEVVAYSKENFGLTLERMELLKGYELKADTLFAALFTAPTV